MSTMAVRIAESVDVHNHAISMARNVCASAIRGYLAARGLPGAECLPSSQKVSFAEEHGRRLASLPLKEAAYELGGMYAQYLPEDYQRTLGVYYTPPRLADHLLDLLEEAGVDWEGSSVLDPACGGGAFLLTVADRLDRRLGGLSRQRLAEHLRTRVRGYEIDSFAASVTRAFLRAFAAERGIPLGTDDVQRMVVTADTLQMALRHGERFRVVVGNPPYGRVRLDKHLRDAYARCLWGHANQYALFIDAALRFLEPGGFVGYVTPTSFLSGEYYKNLRYLLFREAPPQIVALVYEREGVFDGVLQETCLTVFRHGQAAGTRSVRVEVFAAQGGKRLPLGSFPPVAHGDDPWLFPRSPDLVPFAEAALKQRYRLPDFGYRVSTGPLVWNRHKRDLRSVPECRTYPLVWAEAVTPDGFSFAYTRRRASFVYVPEEKEQVFVNRQPTVLVQRTTAKEQPRRIVAAVVPQDFVDRFGGYVVENHVNVIHPVTPKPSLSLEQLAALMNTETFDKIFRCISGSTAVSRYELEAIPLPPPELLDGLAVSPDAGRHNERIVRRAYGMER